MGEKTLKVLITGGSRGLGRKMAEHLSRQGHEVYVISRTGKNEIDPSYLSLLAGYIECELNDTNELIACFETLIKQSGSIDVLINNAAARQFDKKFDEFQTCDIQRNINIDLIAPLILSNLCLPIMKRNNFGRIINISSIGAYKVFVTGSLYSSSKRALIAFGETLNLELSNFRGKVAVTTICPGSFSKMDGTPLKNYHLITDSILVKIDNIIQSDKSGMVISVFPFKHKLRESLRFIGRGFHMLVS